LAAVTGRKFFEELGQLVGKPVVVEDAAGKGNNIARIMATDTPFNLDGLKERLDRVFPNMVQTFPEAGVLVVMNKIRVNETGVIEGTGPAASRVQDIYNRFIQETS